MQFGYDKERDIASIYFKYPFEENEIEENINIEETFIFNINKDNKLLEIKIKNATNYLNMAITPRYDYDEKANNFYLYLHYPSEESIEYSTNIEEIPEIILDFGKNDKLIGIEILNVLEIIEISHL